jgi:Glycosyl hydrolases family 16
MSRHRLAEASTVAATVEIAAATRTGRAVGRRARESGGSVAPAAAPDAMDSARHAQDSDVANDVWSDRAALAKELLAAVDGRHAEDDDLRAGREPVAEPAPVRGSRHRRTSGAHVRRHDTEGRPVRRRGARRGRTPLLVAGVAACLLAVPVVGVASADPCGWQRAAHQLIIALDGRTDDRSTMLRNALTQAGVGPQLSAECAQTAGIGAPVGRAETTAVGRTGNAATATDAVATAAPPAAAPQATPAPASRPGTVATKPTPPPASKSAPTSPARAAGADTDSGTTAASTFGWGTPVKSEDFTGNLSQWGLYDGAGHAGKGRRSPSAATVANGILTISGDSNGTTDGMAWGTGQKYGRWEGRVRAPASDPTYNALLLLWPDAENYPVGGEIDFMEMTDHTRQSTNLFLHYGADDSQVHGEVAIDATQWHNWAVEWTPKGVTTYVDGKPWYHTDDTSILPPGPMHLCIQLDWFPKDGEGGSVRPSEMQVDWVKQYAV